MADHQVNLMSILLQCCFGRSYFNEQFINLNFISRTCYLFQPHHALLSRHSNLTFAVSVMLNFAEIKYQGKIESPYETHPMIMLVAVTSVILYCFSYDANLRISSSTAQILSSNSYVCCAVRISMAFSGPLSLASLTSVLFPEGIISPCFLFSVSILFSLCELPCFELFRISWNWVQQIIRVINSCSAELDQQQGRQGGRRRRRRLSASLVYQPRLSLSEHTNELMDQVHTLPV